MASGSESGSGGSRLKNSTAASRRQPTYQAWNPGMDTPF
jgi:hypothetical protein